MDVGQKMKKRKKSTIEKILELTNFLKIARTAEEVKRELKDSLGYNVNIAEVRVSLLRLLRRKKVKREKEGKTYKYHI